jgi:hypothetical protein
MTKPDWGKAPDWANWCAQDQDGQWYWYKNKPQWKDSFWASCGTLHAAAHLAQPTNCRRSLVLRPGVLKKMADYANRS